MIPKGLGQYDLEYAQCPCFWGTRPGKYVVALLSHLQGGSALDLGAGEGKNAIYLAERGFQVTAVECSTYAIKNFEKRLMTVPESVRSKMIVVQADVLKYVPHSAYDVTIAYGLLHCLPNLKAVGKVVNLMQTATVQGGFNVIAAFTTTLPIPEPQKYLQAPPITRTYLSALYKEWNILSCEEDTITEVHPTTNAHHAHSLCRLLARK